MALFCLFFVGWRWTFQDRYSEWKELELLPDKTCVLYDINAGPGCPFLVEFGGRRKGYRIVSSRKSLVTFLWPFYHHLLKYNKIKARNFRCWFPNHWFVYMFFIQNRNLHTHRFTFEDITANYYGKLGVQRLPEIAQYKLCEVATALSTQESMAMWFHMMSIQPIIYIIIYICMFVLHSVVLWSHILITNSTCVCFLKVDHSWIWRYILYISLHLSNIAWQVS